MNSSTKIAWGLFIIAMLAPFIYEMGLAGVFAYLCILLFFLLLDKAMKYRNSRIKEKLDSIYIVEAVNGVITNANVMPLMFTCFRTGSRYGGSVQQVTVVYNYITLLLNDEKEIDIIVSRNADHFTNYDKLQYDDEKYSIGQEVSINIRRHNEYFYCKDEIFYNINNYRDLAVKSKKSFNKCT